MEPPPNTSLYFQRDPNFGSSRSLSTQELDPYPSWCLRNGAPLSAEDIRGQFIALGMRFQFQPDNVENMYDYLMCQLNSRASRTTCQQALLSIHRDYIGGDNANYKRWYFAVWSGLQSNYTLKEWQGYKCYKKLCTRLESVVAGTALPEQEKHLLRLAEIAGTTIEDGRNSNPLLRLEYEWKSNLYCATETEYIQQLGLYLLIWGEANNVRFIPEGLCFIFKISWDYWKLNDNSSVQLPTNYFLDKIITPLYQYIRSQKYQQTESGIWKRRNLSHDRIISYDDINQFFWSADLIKNITLKDGNHLLAIREEDRFSYLEQIQWDKQFLKTYKEFRTWHHLMSNFTRVWIIHFTMFWFFTVFNSPTLYTVNYSQLLNNLPPPQVHLTFVSLGGTIPPLIVIWSILLEYLFVPRAAPTAIPHTFKRLLLCLSILAINLAPSLYLLIFIPMTVYSVHGYWLSVAQFLSAVLTLVYFAVTPPLRLFNFILLEKVNQQRTYEFAANFAPLNRGGRISSFIFWIFVFGAKFTESYFFLTLSLRDPIRVISIMTTDRCHTDSLMNSKWICMNQPKLILILIGITDFILFFLDTYLWYIICNCLFSIILSLKLGISVLTPWRNIFLRLPERILSKIVYSKASGSPTSLISLIWNAIIISMFREHFLSVEQTRKLLFSNLTDGNIRPPVFFVFQDDSSFSLKDYFACGEEAERRITFLAHSISSSITEPLPVKATPTFTVLIPHYSEKIILSLRELLKEAPLSRISLLDYLKQLHPNDWNVFVKDTKTFRKVTSISDSDRRELMGEQDPYSKSEQSEAQPLDPESHEISKELNNESGKEDLKLFVQNEIDDIPYYCVGYKDSTPENCFRTRIWASLRCQTLYRTVSGFTNYQTALRLLYKAENKGELQNLFSDEEEQLLDEFSQSKFHLLIAMQKFQHFSSFELEDARSLFESFPQCKICYLEEENLGEEKAYYSTLLDVSSITESGNYAVKYRIKLSGNPMLGDGKADNQNNALIYSRGEYIQTIDANQDNYLEECLKIKSVLAEFEELQIDALVEYLPGSIGSNEASQVAILGAREHIFSENVGVLGDLAAAKEQTFGTLFARTLAAIGAKLHYGHPDFLNLIFMTTRGGISKATRELHLNEDIYAGMNAVSRGGRIKHCDFYQCGKGRDLGFATILNFTSKIGAGMGEQLLSREYYYLGSSLPTDRFLSFYYAHAGFHVNNLFIILSIKIVTILLVNLGALVHETIMCNLDPKAPVTGLKQPLGCYDLQPILQWVARFVLSVCICFMISFLPLIIQETVEKGIWRSFKRIGKHLISLSPLFEVFVCNIYAESLRRNMVYGGANYVPTGRGFAITRNLFLSLYSRYATLSIHLGAFLAISLLFITITIWQPAILWFYISVISLCYSPFLFNPHQFRFKDYILDYQVLLRWFFRSHKTHKGDSWVSYLKLELSLIIGQKLQQASTKVISSNAMKRPARWNCFWDRIFLQFLKACSYFTAYLFINSQNGVRNPEKVSPILRIIIISFFPLVANSAVLIVSLVFSLTVCPVLRLIHLDISILLSTVAFLLAVVIHLISFVVLFFCESWNVPRTLCGILCIVTVHNFMLQLMLFFATREPRDDVINEAWWSGAWFGKGLGFKAVSLLLRETYVKAYEINVFAYDYILCHWLFITMLPICSVPYIDKLHTMALMWLVPSQQFSSPIVSKKERTRRNWKVFWYGLLLALQLIVMLSMVIVPPILDAQFGIQKIAIETLGPDLFALLVQPVGQDFNDTGVNAPLHIPRQTPAFTMSTIA